MNTWMDGGPPNTCYNVTKSGWMEDYVFEAWFVQVFIEYLKDKEKPVIVFFDGHGSHLTYQTASNAKHENIHIICLPPTVNLLALCNHWMLLVMVRQKRNGTRF